MNSIRILLMLGILDSVQCIGQSVQDVIDRYFTATGGREAWQRIQTLTRAGKSTTRPKSHPLSPSVQPESHRAFEYLFERPHKKKFTTRPAGADSLAGILCYDGTRMWTKVAGMAATYQSSEHAAYFVATSMLGIGDLFLGEATIEYLGLKYFQDKNYQVLQIQRPLWMIPHEYYFDPESGLLVYTTSSQAQQQRITKYSEYRRFGDVLLHTIETVYFSGVEESVTVYSDSRVNVPLAVDEFSFPK